MKRFLFIAATWILSGLLTFFLDKIRKKSKHETPFTLKRAIWAGYIGLIFTAFLALFPPKTIKR